MQATIRAHLQVNRIEPETFFRAAYMARFGKDHPPKTLAEELEEYRTRGRIPQYVVDYMVSKVGCRS